MTNKTILKKYAKKIGDNPESIYRMFEDKMFNTYGNKLRMDLVRGYIFDIDNAKAFWGEGNIPFGENKEMGWEDHLQQMVLEKEPLKYIEKFI